MAYSLPNTLSNGTPADAGQVMQNFNALLAAANNSLSRDGTLGPSANQFWNGFDLTGVGNIGAASGAIAGNLTVGGTLGLTGALTAPSLALTGNLSAVNGTFAGALNVTGLGAFIQGVNIGGASGQGGIQLEPTGDLVLYRNGGTTGAIFFTQDLSRFLYYDGTSYTMPGAGLNITGGSVGVSGSISAAGTIASSFAGNASVSLAPADSLGNSGQLQFFNGSGTREAYMYMPISTGTFVFGRDSGDFEFDNDTIMVANLFKKSGASFGYFAWDGSFRGSAMFSDGTAAPAGGTDGQIYFQYA